MAKYFITYELKEQENASGLETALESLGAERAFEAVWHIDLQSGKSQQVKDSLAKHTGRDERVLIIESSDFSVK